MKSETTNQMEHWIRAMTREIIVHDNSPMTDKFEKIQMAEQLAMATYQRTSPYPEDVADNDQTSNE